MLVCGAVESLVKAVCLMTKDIGEVLIIDGWINGSLRCRSLIGLHCQESVYHSL